MIDSSNGESMTVRNIPKLCPKGILFLSGHCGKLHLRQKSFSVYEKKSKEEQSALLQTLDLSGLHLSQVSSRLFTSFFFNPFETIQDKEPLSLQEHYLHSHLKENSQFSKDRSSLHSSIRQRRKRKARKAQRIVKKLDEEFSDDSLQENAQGEENIVDEVKIKFHKDVPGSQPTDAFRLLKTKRHNYHNNQLKRLDYLTTNAPNRQENSEGNRKQLWNSFAAELENKLKERNNITNNHKSDVSYMTAKNATATSHLYCLPLKGKTSDDFQEIPPPPPFPNFLLEKHKPDLQLDDNLRLEDASKLRSHINVSKGKSGLQLVRNTTRRKSLRYQRPDIKSSDSSPEISSRRQTRTGKNYQGAFEKGFSYFSLPSHVINARRKKPRVKKIYSTEICDLESYSESDDEISQRLSPVLSDKFYPLKEVQLCRNRLVEFPESLFGLPYLVKIDLSWNQIKILPERIFIFSKLEILNASHNLLQEVDVSSLKKLKSLELESNRLSKLPIVNEATINLLNVSNNQIWNISSSSLIADNNLDRMEECLNEKQGEEDLFPVSLQLNRNRITGAVTLASFQHVTELDVSDNGITSLEVTSLASLTSLTCSNNDIVSISLHGAVLQSFVADNNRVSSIRVKSHPRLLETFTISKNCLGSVPPWLVSCNKLQYLDISKNNLTSLPAYVTSGHLEQVKYLAANHNHLEAVSTSQGIPDSALTTAEREKKSNIEILLLHHNEIENLSSTFFSNFPRLRVLNISSNKLHQIPDGGLEVESEEISLSLQEFYAGNNSLKDLRPFEVCQSLRILHVPFNRITVFSESLCWSCGLLEEIVLSGNQISALPSSISRLSRLSVLKIHLNPIKNLPRLSHLSSLKVIDASHCKLGKVEFESVVGSSLSTLDIAANASLTVDCQHFTKCRPQVNFVKTTSEKENSSNLPDDSLRETEEEYSDIDGEEISNSSSDIGQRKSHVQDLYKNNNNVTLPWTIGFCESVGRNEDLTLRQLRIADLEENGTVGLVALAEGGNNAENVDQLFSIYPKTLREEKLCCPDLTDALKFSLLACLRKIILTQGVVPEAFCSAYLENDSKINDNFNSRRSVRNPKLERQQGSTLRFCCFGDITAIVTSNNGPPQVVSSSPRVKQDVLDKCKKSGSCDVPSSIPDPQTHHVRLNQHHKSFVIASASLWEVIEPEEVNQACQSIDDPAVCAKRLLTLAQSYGSKKALSILITTLPSVILRNSYLYSSLGTKKAPYKDKSSLSPKKSKRNFGRSHESQSDQTFSSAFNEERQTQVKEDDYSYPRCSQSDSDELSQSQCESVQNYNTKNSTNIGRYYQYPTNRNLSCSCDNLTSLKSGLKNDVPSSLDATYGLLSPPVGFGDSETEEDSDSGFSGNSNGKVIIDNKDVNQNSSNKCETTAQRVRNWENLVANNARTLYLHELDSIESKKNAPVSSSSVPNLTSILSEDDTKEMTSEDDVRVTRTPLSHFQRNVIRKSRFARGALKLLQNKFSNTLKINESFHKINSIPKESFMFKRFGSLQNLKHYQMSKLFSFSSTNISEIESEMIEKPSVDVLELESRMHHYWNTGVTCF